MATALLTVMAPFLGASFPEYSLGVLGALGLTSGLIAFEDKENKKNSESTRMIKGTTQIEENGLVGQQKMFELEQAKGASANSHSN